ncbi:FMN-dependent NADH-azoreductase [Amycolatopsis pigmentata]|uniref:FMN dependent NADH:quinone oxidoreductase n=1 Tax=Amycolatopsis pigmentata TaxID=450801 RepID=A0ABW5FNB5_9PSEU
MLLQVDSSASDTRDSVSRQLTSLFAETWRSRHGPVGYRDLAAAPVPPLTRTYVTLGQRVEGFGTVPLGKVAELAENADERREWDLTLPLIDEVRAAGTVLIGAPMYNLSISAALKAWIDRIGFPGVFTDPVSGRSLLRDKEVVVVTTRGGGYGPELNFQTPYLRAVLGKLGFSRANLTFIEAEFTRAEDVPGLARFRDHAAKSLAAAREAVLRRSRR